MIPSKNHTLFLFLLLIVLHLLIYHLASSLVSDDLLYQDMSENLGSDMATDAIEKRNNVGYGILKYIFQALWIIIKILGTLFVVTTGMNAFNIKISFFQALSFAVIPLYIFLAPDLLKYIWFGLLNGDYSIDDLNKFPHFGVSDLLVIANLIEDSGFVDRLLSVINIYNILFCYFFSRIIIIHTGKNSIVYKAAFIPFFSCVLALRLLMLSFTTIISR